MGEIKQSLPYAVAVALVENNSNLDLVENEFVYKNNDKIKIKIKNKSITKNKNNISNSIDNKLYNDLIKNKSITKNKNNISNSIDNELYNDLIKNILNKIIIEEDEKFTKLNPMYRPSKVIIETNNKIYEDFIKLPLGEAENPLSKEDILEKFKKIIPNFDSEKVYTINNCIGNIEDYNIFDFMNNLH